MGLITISGSAPSGMQSETGASALVHTNRTTASKQQDGFAFATKGFCVKSKAEEHLASGQRVHGLHAQLAADAKGPSVRPAQHHTITLKRKLSSAATKGWAG